MATMQYPIGAHELAVGQARAHANLARSIAVGMGEANNPGEILAYLMNAAFSIELYLKTFMLAANNGIVTKGHDLAVLYREFPTMFTNHLAATYAAIPGVSTANVRLTGLRIGAPPAGANPRLPAFSFATFDAAINSLSKVFVEARYFFEQVNPTDWVVIVYPRDAVEGVLSSLETTYSAYLAGQFDSASPASS